MTALHAGHYCSLCLPAWCACLVPPALPSARLNSRPLPAALGPSRSHVGRAGTVKSSHEFLLPMVVSGRGGKVMLAGAWPGGRAPGEGRPLPGSCARQLCWVLLTPPAAPPLPTPLLCPAGKTVASAGLAQLPGALLESIERNGKPVEGWGKDWVLAEQVRGGRGVGRWCSGHGRQAPRP